MGSREWGIALTFFGYLVALLLIGYWGEKKHTKSYEDFVAADKSLGGLVSGLSAAASSESVWVMLGLSGLGYWYGLKAIWAAIGCLLGFLFNALFITVQLRRDAERYSALTLSDYFERKLQDKRKILRFVSAGIIAFFMFVYVVAQFTGAGKLVVGMELFGRDSAYWHGVILGAVIVGIYIMMGGYAAVCWTDTLQGFLMFFIMLGVPIYAVVQVGGFDVMAEKLSGLGLWNFWGEGALFSASVGFIVGQLGIGLGYPGMPHMLIRYITVSDDKEAERSAWIAVLWSIVVLFGPVILGMSMRVLHPELASTQKLAEKLVLPGFCNLYLNPFLSGLVLSAVTAAIMSTADSQLMYAATVLINDFWLPIRRGEKLSQKKMIWSTRIVLLVMTIAAAVLALLKVRLIYTLVLFAWGALGSAFGPIVIYSLYWKKFNRWGALASMVVGPVTVVIWELTPVLKGAVYSLVPAFFISMLAAFLASVLGNFSKPVKSDSSGE